MADLRHVDSIHRIMRRLRDILNLRAGIVTCLMILLGQLSFICQAASVRTVADPSKPIALDAASIDFNYKDNTAVYRKVRISQGELSVEAQEATASGLNFDNAKWTFK